MNYTDESNFQTLETPNNTEKRPVGLTVLAILTFLGSGLMLFSYFTVFAKYDTMPDMMRQMGEVYGEPMLTRFQQAADMIANTSRTSYLWVAFPYLLSIIGAGFMLAMRKIGFHLYVVAQILILALSMILLKEDFSIMGLFLSIAFVGLYAIFFKRLK